MKSVIALITASLFSVTAFAADTKKEDKKADAKPAATAAKDAKPAPKKEEGKK